MLDYNIGSGKQGNKAATEINSKSYKEMSQMHTLRGVTHVHKDYDVSSPNALNIMPLWAHHS